MKDSINDFITYYGAIPGSPAEKSGLQVGDKIVSLNGMPILSPEDLDRSISGSNYGKRIVEVLRNNKILTIEIDLNVSAEDFNSN